MALRHSQRHVVWMDHRHWRSRPRPWPRGKYLILPQVMPVLSPTAVFMLPFKTNHVLYAVRAFMDNNDPKPSVALIKKSLKIYPYTPGGAGTSIARHFKEKIMLHWTHRYRRRSLLRGAESRSTRFPKRLFLLRDAQRARSARAATSFSPELLVN